MSSPPPKRLLSPSISPPLSKRPRPAPITKSVRFLILSDTHSHSLPSHPACDVLLHCGDLTEDGSASSISSALQALGKIPAELKLAIPGNHEISLDRQYYVSEGGSEAECLKARELVEGSDSLAAQNGITVLEEGTHEFVLQSGAMFTIYASPWTPKEGLASGAFMYPSTHDRFNPASSAPTSEKDQNVGTETSIIPKGVDILMTHGPPQYILDLTSDGRNIGCRHLRRAIARVSPRLHCFGHVHRGYGALRVDFDGDEIKEGHGAPTKEFVGQNQAKRKGYASLPPGSVENWKRKGQTLCINAAIIDEKEEPGNMPWVVDMELPVESTAEERREEQSGDRAVQTSDVRPSSSGEETKRCR